MTFDEDATDASLFAFRRNVVVAASAGTGKTHRLTALYLLLTLGLTSMGQEDARTPCAPVPPDRIVATTFSRAAALEISRRVEQALRALATWDGSAGAATGEPGFAFAGAVLGRVEALGGGLYVTELRARASQALARWGSARIDTLHGVAGQIARAHAVALGLPPGARVLDEEESQALGDLAVDEALGDALAAGGERADAARALIAAASGVAGARDAVTRLLDRLDEEGLAPADLALGDHAGPALSLARELVRVARAAAVGGSETVRVPAASLAAELGVYATELEGGAAALPVFPAGAIRSAAELFAVRKPSGRKRTAADEELAEFVAGLAGSTKADKAAQLAALLIEAPQLPRRERATVALLEGVRRRLVAARRRARALAFGDLLRAARDGLRDRPEVGRAVRESLDALLVDEFQDTSRVQRDLVYLLREREGARAPGEAPAAEALTAHGLFLVGDRKQSIYGFRGADVAVFARVCAELAGREAGEALNLPGSLWADRAGQGGDRGGAGPVADFVALRESRRSGEAVLSFVNAFAALDLTAAGGEARDFEVVYGPGEQLVPAPGTARPRGEVVLLRDDGTTPEAAEPIVRGAAGPMREAFVAAAFVARESAGGGVALRDVAVLARRRSTIPLVELALGRLGVPYVVAGRALFDAREVRDVAALLRLLLDPEDRLALATVLRGPIAALSDGALAALSSPGAGLALPLAARSRGEARQLEARLADVDPAERARLTSFRARFDDLRRAALRLAPAEAIRAAVTAMDLDRVLAALPRAEARIGNVDRLVTLARRRRGTLATFVRWLDRRIADEADEAEAAVFSPEDDAVRLTTIHASKGLDFGVVVLVDLDAAPRGSLPGIALRPSTGADPAALVMRHVVRHPERPQPLALGSAALREARADASAREHAERARLTYVAMTRARERLVLVGHPGEGRRGTAWRTLAAGLEGLAASITRVEDAAPLLALAPRRADDRGAAAPPRTEAPPERPARSAARALAIATTPLSLFRGCARRFRFRYLLGLDEPVSSGQLDLFGGGEAPVEPPPFEAPEEDAPDPRDLGRAAHRVLERWPLERWGAPTPPAEIARALALEGLEVERPEAARIAAGVARFLSGAYARRLAQGAEVRREEEIVLSVRGAGPELALRGAIDLLAARADGAVDVVDYKLSSPRADLSPYEFQLRAYALAAARRYPGRVVRAGVLFLGHADEPSFLQTGDPAAFEAELAALAERFAEARHGGRFDGVEEPSCRRQHCGFLAVCHGSPPGPGSRGGR